MNSILRAFDRWPSLLLLLQFFLRLVYSKERLMFRIFPPFHARTTTKLHVKRMCVVYIFSLHIVTV